MNASKTPDFIFSEPEKVYRAKAKENLSSHQLADFRKCPQLYRKKQLDLIKDEDRPAYLIGRAAHKLILEGQDTFNKSYAVGGPVNPRTGNVYGANTKAYHEWADAQGKPALTDAQSALITNLAAGVQAHKLAKVLLSEGIAEGVVRTEYCGIQCQARFDFFNPGRGVIDLKTCDDLTWFEVDARRHGYLHQVAFYRAVLAAAAAGKMFPVHLIAVEKKEPYRCGVWRVGDDVLGMAQKENEAAMRRVLKCREVDNWPTGYEEVRTFDYL
ncbi:MAG: hypothetical protein E3J72_04575 [Planctomycetota bacterium]|nr:MAG: hypothetical protein E3J72_04575 [Planctomycetota bacterium]